MTSGLLSNISWTVYIVKSHSILHSSFSLTISSLCSCYIFFTSLPFFLRISQLIFVLNQSSRLLHSFWANLLHLVNTWFTHLSMFLLLALITCSCAAIIKAPVFLFKHPFLSHPYQSSLILPVVCLINCPGSCFCVRCVFLSFFFFILYSFGVSLFHFLLLYVQQLTISYCCFLHNLLTSKLLSPQYLGLQWILRRLHFSIDTIIQHYF